MRTFSIVCMLIAVLTAGCFGGTYKSSVERNGIPISQSWGSSGWGHAEAHTRLNTQTYDNCLAQIGHVPATALPMAVDTCIENSLVKATSEACPAMWGQMAYQPYAWRESFGECLARLDGMPDEQAQGLCAREIVKNERQRMCGAGGLGYGAYGYMGGAVMPNLR
jgi:hypothetical protein